MTPHTPRPDAPDDLTIDVTDADVRAARDAWAAARDGGAAEARVEQLHRGYERLVRTQSRQLGEALRRRHVRAAEA
ncbi:hypothetical protein [Actinotalea solisilvae]|uniref:hypothetical protein n=1 Tax=Actinotalea solisilvae TaxID=2072922 RepID=UPI0018F2246B|nr:hypothetical protein [Actinotalea solisilvae]